MENRELSPSGVLFRNYLDKVRSERGEGLAALGIQPDWQLLVTSHLPEFLERIKRVAGEEGPKFIQLETSLRPGTIELFYAPSACLITLQENPDAKTYRTPLMLYGLSLTVAPTKSLFTSPSLESIAAAVCELGDFVLERRLATFLPYALDGLSGTNYYDPQY